MLRNWGSSLIWWLPDMATIADAIKSCADPRELRIAIALADIRLQQISLSEQLDSSSLEAKGEAVSRFQRAGLYFAALQRRCCASSPTSDDGEFDLAAFVAGALVASLIAWMV